MNVSESESVGGDRSDDGRGGGDRQRIGYRDRHRGMGREIDVGVGQEKKRKEGWLGCGL